MVFSDLCERIETPKRLTGPCNPLPVLMEWLVANTEHPHLPQWLDFKNGKIWPNKRPGLGVTLDLKTLTQVGEVTQRGPERPIYFRPDGSQTNW